jgi:hypothetical protein
VKRVSQSGLSIVEISVVTAIFSIFLLGFYIAIETGFKGWKIGIVKADIQTTSESVKKRLIKDIENASNLAIQTYTAPTISDNSYICIDTPLYNGQLQKDPNSSNPLWQGYILYYTLDDPEGTSYNKKILYRRYIPHEKVYPYFSNNIITATLLYNISDYISATVLTPAEKNEGQILTKIANRLYSVKFSEDSGVIKIELVFKDNIKQNKDYKISFNSGDKIGTETITVKHTIKPRN